MAKSGQKLNQSNQPDLSILQGSKLELVKSKRCRYSVNTYISGELLEGMKHVEAMEVYDPCSQRVIVSDHRVKELKSYCNRDVDNKMLH